jgi:membrane-bound lytic murein transglycosylase B
MGFKMPFFFITLIAVLTFSSPASAAGDFGLFMQNLRKDAARQGISQGTIDQALHAGLKPIPRIIQLDRKQPEKTIGFSEYYEKIVNATRIQKGRQKINFYQSELSKASQKYSVPESVIVALWGIETSYGQNMGSFHVVDALVTLAYDGRRSAYFRKELMNALQIIDDKHISYDNMIGSWAGAMGHCQFMPSSFLSLAQDGNGDGRKDIWGTKEDVFASTAHYLAKNGWQKSEPILQEVSLSAFKKREVLNKRTYKTLDEWARLGVRNINGKNLKGHTKARLVEPRGSKGRAFLAFNNYDVILKWNNSSYFATSVGLLSQAISR